MSKATEASLTSGRGLCVDPIIHWDMGWWPFCPLGTWKPEGPGVKSRFIPRANGCAGFEFPELALRDLVCPTILSWRPGDLMSMDQVMPDKRPQTQQTMLMGKVEARSCRWVGGGDQEKHGLLSTG